MNLRNHNYRLTSAVLSISAGILYSLWVFGYALNRTAIDTLDVSALQSKGQPYYRFFVVGDVITGVLVFLLVICLIKLFQRTKLHRKVSFWLCMAGLLTFGLMTGIACFLKSCDTNSSYCLQNLNEVFDSHNITGTIASLGQFMSLASGLTLIRKRISRSLYWGTWTLTVLWALSGLSFIITSTQSLSLSLLSQHVFLVLSSLCLVAITWVLARPKFQHSL